jgi:hypothetical protein
MARPLQLLRPCQSSEKPLSRLATLVPTVNVFASAVLSCSRNDRGGKVWDVKRTGCCSPFFMDDAFNLRLLGAAPLLGGTAPSSFRSCARRSRHPRSSVCVTPVTNILPSGSRYTLCFRCLIRFALCSLSRRKTSSLESIRAPLRCGRYGTASGEEAGRELSISLPVYKAYVDWVYFFVKIKAWQNGRQLMKTTSKAAIYCGSTDAYLQSWCVGADAKSASKKRLA